MGRTYVNGLNALLTNGVLTPEGYDYWPAGYPILLYIFGLPFRSLTLVSAAVLQTLIYAAAMAYFIDRIATTRLRRFAIPLALILAFNPTLSFNSYAIGYESPAAALLFPAFLVVRNAIATGQAYISTNLGVTMRIGAGPGATGGYGNGSSQLVCPEVEGSPADKDNAVVGCVVNWYP